MNWTIRRHYLPDVTLGTLYDPEGLPCMLTLEEPWKNNQRKISCIPEGTYECKPHTGAKFQRVWEVTNVKGRSAILIHSGNSTADIEGCILVGGIITSYSNKKIIAHSMDALNELRKRIGAGSSFTLTIKGE